MGELGESGESRQDRGSRTCNLPGDLLFIYSLPFPLWLLAPSAGFPLFCRNAVHSEHCVCVGRGGMSDKRAP